jgi:hypothetical protein
MSDTPEYYSPLPRLTLNNLLGGKISLATVKETFTRKLDGIYREHLQKRERSIRIKQALEFSAAKRAAQGAMDKPMSDGDIEGTSVF